MKNILLAFCCVFALVSCRQKTIPVDNLDKKVYEEVVEEYEASINPINMDEKLKKYTSFKLKADLSHLSTNQKKMVSTLINASKIMDDLFWVEALGNKKQILNSATESERKYIEINYGPWDRLDGNSPFIKGTPPKALGANYYPSDMTKEEFENADIVDKASLYTFIRRDKNGQLISIPYHKMFEEEVARASALLLKAADLAENKAFEKYLRLRAAALLNDEYQESDMAWLDMKDNPIDLVYGPIETYEDQLFGYKAAHEAYVLIKDMEWSKRLEKYAAFLPDLQKGLPVDPAYKAETPGNDTELNAYDVVYYAGDCNAGSKTIAINLPNDEEVQLAKGTRRLQLKNAMQAKFDKILIPIADELIAEDQRKHITFNAFFSNTMFHEVAHGLGIKNTINGKGTVRSALKELASALEEGKADALGLYMINQLHKKGEIKEDLHDFYVTFMTSIFRSVRFGASSAHGKANMIRFNYFKELDAFTRHPETGRYRINFDKFQIAVDKLSETILTIQGDGDYDRCAALVSDYANIGETLAGDLDMLAKKGIPVDIIFEQGAGTLGLFNK